MKMGSYLPGVLLVVEPEADQSVSNIPDPVDSLPVHHQLAAGTHRVHWEAQVAGQVHSGQIVAEVALPLVELNKQKFKIIQNN